MFQTSATQLHFILSGRDHEQQRRVSDVHSIHKNLRARGRRTKQQFAGILSCFLFQGLPVGYFGMLHRGD